MRAEKIIRLRMQNSTFCRRIPVVQGDTARTFLFILEDITLDGTEHARIYARKPSGAEIYDECDVIGSNEVIFTPETEQIFIETGIIPAEIRVAKGEKLITSYSFEFEVRQSAMRTGDIPSSDEFNALERAIEEAKGLHEPEFIEAGKRENIVSGETMQILFGKIKKWFTDLGALIIKIGNKDISSIGDGTVTGAITDLDKRNTKNTSDIDIERKRIDNIAKLPEGATTGDAELTDIRVAADGTSYDTAGEAVRGQINQIDQKYEKETSSLKENINNLKSSSANNESLIVIYDILSKGTYTEDISPLMSQLDGLVHDGMYKITSDVKNATLSNKSNYVTKGSRYKCTVTASIGYKISAVVVTMGGVDISSNYDTTTKTITIESVTGPINITITTIETDYTSLQYIKGDGNSWIDTGVVANVNHRYELSAKLDGDAAAEHFFGADQYNVGSAYNQFYLTAIANHAGIMGTINKKGNVDVGTWNTTEHNLLSNKKMYLVVKNGSQEIYLNSDYTEKQTNYKAGSASFGAQDTLPIIPLYLFHVNTTASTNQNNARGYKRSKITVYWLKIYDDTTNEMLHEFLPVAKNGKIGMLDTVTKEFHANIGTGTFAYEEA